MHIRSSKFTKLAALGIIATLSLSELRASDWTSDDTSDQSSTSHPNSPSVREQYEQIPSQGALHPPEHEILPEWIQPQNHRYPWTTAARREIWVQHNNGIPYQALAAHHGRTETAIRNQYYIGRAVFGHSPGL